jgi:hypothetical protein
MVFVEEACYKYVGSPLACCFFDCYKFQNLTLPLHTKILVLLWST